MPINETITLNKTKDKLFIAIGKQAAHSFVMIGVYDNNGATHLLCRVGKVADISDISPSDLNCLRATEIMCSALFFSTKGAVLDEGVSRTQRNKTPISYQAYELNYQQYLEFINILEGLQTQKKRFKCYKPNLNNPDQELVELNLTTQIRFPPRTDLDSIKDQTCELSINNTCRHSAKKLVSEALNTKYPQSIMVSDCFWSELPCKTQLEYGIPTNDIPFYVLPVSPDAFPDLEAEKRSILAKLYERMELLLLIDPHSSQTKDKFQNLKELYNQISGPQKDLSLDKLLESIKSWRHEHKKIITVLRETYFWDSFFTRESATSKLFTEIEHDLENALFS